MTNNRGAKKRVQSLAPQLAPAPFSSAPRAPFCSWDVCPWCLWRRPWAFAPRFAANREEEKRNEPQSRQVRNPDLRPTHLHDGLLRHPGELLVSAKLKKGPYDSSNLEKRPSPLRLFSSRDGVTQQRTPDQLTAKSNQQRRKNVKKSTPRVNK